MIGLDCNILVQIAIADHPANAATVSTVWQEMQRGTKLVFPSLVATEFLHVVTDPRRFAPPLTMSEALDWLEEFVANPLVEILQPTPDSTKQTILWMRQFNLGRKRILDTHLSAILYTSGVRRLLTSNPADFKIFGVLQTVTP
jgi:predicted nucleic acid-binding protein